MRYRILWLLPIYTTLSSNRIEYTPARSNYGDNPFRFKDWYMRCSKFKGFIRLICFTRIVMGWKFYPEIIIQQSKEVICRNHQLPIALRLSVYPSLIHYLFIHRVISSGRIFFIFILLKKQNLLMRGQLVVPAQYLLFIIFISISSAGFFGLSVGLSCPSAVFVCVPDCGTS